MAQSIGDMSTSEKMRLFFKSTETIEKLVKTQISIASESSNKDLQLVRVEFVEPKPTSMD